MTDDVQENEFCNNFYYFFGITCKKSDGQSGTINADKRVYNVVKEMLMKFYSTRELRSTPKALWDVLANDGEVIITNNGKPSALMVNIPDGQFEETVRAVRQAKAMLSFNLLRMQAAKRGYFSEEEIEAEIKAVRAAKK